MKKINIIYWNADNFGDVLNPVLIEELSGRPAQFKDITLSKKDRLGLLAKAFFQGKPRKCHTILFPWEKSMTAIGSIISWAKKNSVVWGSGFMNEDERFQGGETRAVRGKFTDKKLKEDGFEGCTVFGDPALLLPLWIEPQGEKKYPLSLIPHWSEVEYFKKKYGDRYHIIDLRTRDVEKVVHQVMQSEAILSTSLHGLIVGHAYGVPSLWIKHGYIDTDGFKFQDYFSSVDIPLYDGFENIAEILASDRAWKSHFSAHSDKTCIKNSLQQIQINLLKAAPFALREKYAGFIAQAVKKV